MGAVAVKGAETTCNRGQMMGGAEEHGENARAQTRCQLLVRSGQPTTSSPLPIEKPSGELTETWSPRTRWRRSKPYCEHISLPPRTAAGAGREGDGYPYAVCRDGPDGAILLEVFQEALDIAGLLEMCVVGVVAMQSGKKLGDEDDANSDETIGAFGAIIGTLIAFNA